ncbi:MAG: FAD-binding oxidoreductase [Desulfobacterales bacterium]|nr:FAD-binding oxidoreductase [Desulfobacterales bacterium]
MAKKCDVLIIGSGIMGTSMAFELCKKGYQTLNIDKLSAAGLGSTLPLFTIQATLADFIFV